MERQMNRDENQKRVELRRAASPKPRGARVPVMLTEETMRARREKVLAAMQERGLEVLVVYDDLEHCSNFEYLTGFLTRFEEGMLVLHRSGKAFLLLGNENVKMAKHSRIGAECIHVPFFSLPNQPMEGECAPEEYFRMAGMRSGQKTGVAGWKLFTGSGANKERLLDVPAYLAEAIGKVVGSDCAFNAAELFIGPSGGVRVTNNANEIAHYAYGAALSGDCMLRAMDLLEEGVSETAVGAQLAADGQRHSVVSIAAFGERYGFANYYPTDRRLRVGDAVSLTTGFKGGLSSRAGYAVRNADELADGAGDYLEQLAYPYFAAVTAWMEQIRIGMTGGELYRLIEEVLPLNDAVAYCRPYLLDRSRALTAGVQKRRDI